MNFTTSDPVTLDAALGEIEAFIANTPLQTSPAYTEWATSRIVLTDWLQRHITRRAAPHSQADIVRLKTMKRLLWDMPEKPGRASRSEISEQNASLKTALSSAEEIISKLRQEYDDYKKANTRQPASAPRIQCEVEPVRRDEQRRRSRGGGDTELGRRDANAEQAEDEYENGAGSAGGGGGEGGAGGPGGATGGASGVGGGDGGGEGEDEHAVAV